MTIRRIHIGAFGPLRDFDAELYSGMNVIRGDNESGKTSLAGFIKFIFYGLSGRSAPGEVSERKKFVNWDTGTAEGYLVISHGDREFRIERNLSVTVRAGSDKEAVSETVTVTDTATGGRVFDLEQCPGAALFGVPEQVFVNTVFSGQSAGSKVDGADTAAAVENMLFSADETVNVKKAAEKLDKFRRALLHKKGGGGEIPKVREECAALKDSLEIAGAHAADIIELEDTLELNLKAEAEVDADIAGQNAALEYYSAECLCREGEDAREADREKEAAETKLREALSMCCELSRLREARELAAKIDAERLSSGEFWDRIRELEAGAENLRDPSAPEDPESEKKFFEKQGKAARRLLIPAVACMALAVVSGGGTAVLYLTKSPLFLPALGIAAFLLVLSGVFFILRGGRHKKMREICRSFGEGSEEGFYKAVDYEMSRRAEAAELLRRADSVKLSLEQSAERLESLENEAAILSASFEDCCQAEYSPADGTDNLERLRAAIALAERRQVAAEGLRAAYETAAQVAGAKWQRIPKDKLASAEEHLRREEPRDFYPSDDESAEILKRELSFNLAKREALRRKNHAVEVELAGKKAVAKSPADLWDELNTATERLRKMETEYDAVELAAATLFEASENVRRDIVPKIVRRASEYFTDATEGRYEALGSDGAFEMNAILGGHVRDISYLSSGTEDLAYVCLRVALAAELFGERRAPLIFDESLAFMDPARSAAATDILTRSGHQVLLFTCKNEGSPTLTLSPVGTA